MLMLSQLSLVSQKQNFKTLPYPNQPLWPQISASPDKFQDVSPSKSSQVHLRERLLDWYFPLEALWVPSKGLGETRLCFPSLRVKKAH